MPSCSACHSRPRVRNLGKMTAVGLVKPFSAAANLVIRKLGDEALRRGPGTS